jgi:predicted protein tyrosine phosphatase
MKAPIPDSYVVPGSRLAAGEYPGSEPGTPVDQVTAKLEAFLDAGITAFVDLTDPADGLDPYLPALESLASARGLTVWYEQLTIRDMRVCDVPHMRRVLGAIDGHLDAGRAVYVHCWGGIGRTGMVIGCWLVRQGNSAEAALAEVDRLFRSMSPQKLRRHGERGSPETEAQRAFVRGWAHVDQR